MGDTQPRRLEETLARELLRGLTMVGLGLVQVTLLITPLGFSIPLLLIITVCQLLVSSESASPERDILRTLRLILYGGLALDLLSATDLGVHILALLLAALFVMLVTHRLRVEGLFIPLLAMLGASPIYELTLTLTTNAIPTDWLIYSRVILLPALLMALIPTLPIYFGLRWLLYRQKERE